MGDKDNLTTVLTQILPASASIRSITESCRRGRSSYNCRRNSSHRLARERRLANLPCTSSLLGAIPCFRQAHLQ